MFAPGSVAALAANIPFGDLMGVNVVVDGVAPVAERTGRALAVVVGVEGRPPIAFLSGHVVGKPFVLREVPLHTERDVIVPLLDEVTLLPQASVDERNVGGREG